MKKISIVTLSLSVLLLASCSSKKASTAKATDIHGVGVVQYPVVVDLDVKEQKVSGTAEWKGGGTSIAALKEMAMADAIKKSNADVLVEPVFDIEVKGRKKTVTAMGYPANYKNFRNAVASDTLVAKIGLPQKTDTHEALPNSRKLKRTLVTVGSSVAGGLLFLVLLLTL